MLLNDKILDVFYGKTLRLMVFQPPRHGKSELISNYTPAWWEMRRPDDRCILASYQADFASGWGRKARDLVEQVGEELAGITVSGASHAANRWDIEGHRGGMWTAGARGPLTGKGAELIIIDDPVKNDQEANSAVYREALYDWYRATLSTRLHQGGAIILVMTRWHEDDLAGRLLKDAEEGGDQWEVLSLPAICEDPQNDPLGRKLGDPLCPEMFPLEELEKIRARIGSYWFAALYQQRPVPHGGGIFQRDWFNYYTTMDDGLQLPGAHRVFIWDEITKFITIDPAASERTEADYTAIGVWGMTPETPRRLVLLDMVRERMAAPRIIPTIHKLKEKWGAYKVGIETVGFQLALFQQAIKEGLPAVELKPDKDKVSRALHAAAFMEQGRVLFPRQKPFVDTLEHELLSFPKGEHDDQVDTLSYAAKWLEGIPSMPEPPGSRKGGLEQLETYGVRRPLGW